MMLIWEGLSMSDDVGEIVRRLRRMMDMTSTGNDLLDIGRAADALERLVGENERVQAYVSQCSPNTEVAVIADQLAAAVARALAAEARLSEREWQPIETAPKDRKIDLLYAYPRGRTIDCEWREGGVDGDGRWCWLKPVWSSQPGMGIDWHLLPESEWEVCSYPNMEPTHWTEASAPPVAGQPMGGGDDQ